jgi:hypothetical protein
MQKTIIHAQAVGKADPEVRTAVTAIVRPRKPKASWLRRLKQLNSKHPRERKYLSREELAVWRGADPDDLDQIGAFAHAHHLSMTESLMAGCPSLVTRYHVEDNHLLKIHEEIGKQIIETSPLRPDLPAGVPCTVTVSDLVGGIMRVTDVRRFVEGEPVK